jgi:hypothetical protein
MDGSFAWVYSSMYITSTYLYFFWSWAYVPRILKKRNKFITINIKHPLENNHTYNPRQIWFYILNYIPNLDSWDSYSLLFRRDHNWERYTVCWRRVDICTVQATHPTGQDLYHHHDDFFFLAGPVSYTWSYIHIKSPPAARLTLQSG